MVCAESVVIIKKTNKLSQYLTLFILLSSIILLFYVANLVIFRHLIHNNLLILKAIYPH